MEDVGRLKHPVGVDRLSTQPQAVIRSIIRPIIMLDGEGERKDWERQ